MPYDSDAGTRRGGQGGPLPPPQFLADQLTLFQPGEGILSPPITTSPHFFHLPASLYEKYGKSKDAVTGKSFSEALILASTNPQYDKRLFIEL